MSKSTAKKSAPSSARARTNPHLSRSKSKKKAAKRSGATKTAPAAPGVKAIAPTRDALIADLQRVQAAFPDSDISRNFYRSKGAFQKDEWDGFFPRFPDFKEAAGIKVAAAEVEPTPAAEPDKPQFTDRDYSEDNHPEGTTFERLPSGGYLVYGERGYTYNSQTDTYVLFPRRKRKNIVVPGEDARAMLRMYSNLGERGTINQLAMKFRLSRSTFEEIRYIMGWTHDTDIFTTEEHITRGDSKEGREGMTDEMIAISREAVTREYQTRNWQEIQGDADKFRQWDAFIVQPIINNIRELTPAYAVPKIAFPDPKMRFAVVTSSGELHYNKHGWVGETGETYNREIADQRIADATIALMSDVSRYGRPEKWVYVIGNDDLHVDNMDGKTTAGTMQDVDGTARQMLQEFYHIQLREINRLRSVAPVVVKVSSGNHNALLAYAMAFMVWAHYEAMEDVDVHVTAQMRSYETYGESILGFTHGHLLNSPKLMPTMGHDVPQAWGQTRYRYWFTGHKHSVETENLVGGTKFQMPSLAGQDRWHAENGYIGQAGLSGYIIERETGLKSILFCPAVPVVTESTSTHYVPALKSFKPQR